MWKKQCWQGEISLSSTNTFRQVGLLIGLAVSVVIGAAVVLWLWMPGGDGDFGRQDNRGFNAAPNSSGMQNAGYGDKITSLSAGNYGHDIKGKLLTLSGAQLEYTQRLEASFTQRIERLLEPILGAESIRAQVTADIDFTARERTLETYNPDSRVLRNNELEERVKDNVGSEKPEVLNKLRREVNSYELDKTIRLTRSAIGRIDKLYITVIVDDKLSRGVKGNTIRTPHTKDELDRLTDLVKKAVGFNARRGDVVSVSGATFKIRRSLNHQLYNNASTGPSWGQVWVKDLFNKTLGTLLVLLIIFSVIRPAIKSLVSLPANLAENTFKNGSHYNSGSGDFRDNADTDLSEITGSGDYEKNMITVARVVERDPKLVAQIMKNWVSADGT